MSISFDQVHVNKCYQNAAGEVRRVTSISESGDVTFVSFEGRSDASDEVPIENEQMPGALFAADAEKEVACPEA